MQVNATSTQTSPHSRRQRIRRRTAHIAQKARWQYFRGMKASSTISRSDDIMGGAPVFTGTRVPVQTLLDYLEAGDSIGEFLEGFPSVTHGQVIAFLEDAKDRLVESVS
jgi:uncharacterized protein (DUF433 family)